MNSSGWSVRSRGHAADGGWWPGAGLPGGTAAANGGLLPAAGYTRGSETFAGWLESSKRLT